MERLDFDKTIGQIKELGTREQATFLYRMVQVLGAGVIRTLTRYCFARLDEINKQLPEEHPYKKRSSGLIVADPHFQIAKYPDDDRKDQTYQQPGDQ
jgi:hypothetical protein